MIETLIVIVIISILAAILFPAFATAREKARQATCISNMKQLGIGVELYCEDYDDFLPLVYGGPDDTGKLGGWVYFTNFETPAGTTDFDVTKGSLYPYVTSKEIYLCPDDSRGQRNGLSYAMNACVQNPANKLGVHTGSKSLSSIYEPSTMMMIGEEGEPATDRSTNDGTINFLSDTLTDRHSVRSNLLFMDQHVKSCTYTQVIANDYFLNDGVCW